MPNLQKLPSVVSQSAFGLSWVNPNNALVQDGSYTYNAVGPGGGGGTAKQLQLTGFGYNLPSNAVIDGIVLEIYQLSDRSSTSDVYLLYSGGNTGHSTVANPDWVASAGWLTYGSPTDTWGRTWTPAEINNAAFGASMSAFPPTGVWNISVDGVRITVYYHIGGSTTPADVPTREVYKVRNQKGEYIGLMPRPVEALKIAQDMNSLGSQITLKIPTSIDTAGSDAVPYTTEDLSANYTDEGGNGNYTTEGDLPLVSAAFQGIDTLIKNGNFIECWLYNYFYPNGKRMFIGRIRRWEADTDSNSVDVVLYSTSYDLDNFYVRGSPFTYTNDQVQTSQNATLGINVDGGKLGGWNTYGQTITPAALNQGAITLKLNGTARVTVNAYAGLYGALLGSVSQNVSVGSPTDIQFGFPSLLTPAVGTPYFVEVTVDAGQAITIYYQNTDVYSGGQLYNSNYGGGSAGGAWYPVTGDLYFISASGTGSTQATFTAKDPTTGMFKPIITDYNLRGGSQQWTVSSVDATGLSLNYVFNVQTIFQAMQAILDMCPAGFYYYVDIGAQIIYFKNASTTADFLLQKGVHLTSLKLGATTEQSVNTLPFTGGEVSAGPPPVNLYKLYTNAQSINAFGTLLKPMTDNRVKTDATADAMGQSTVAEFSGEKYFTTVTLVHTTKLDLTLLTPGKTVGFRGWGSFVDQVVAQIVRREWSAGEATLTLGVLPMRLSSEVADLIRSVQQEQTEYNPSTPS